MCLPSTFGEQRGEQSRHTNDVTIWLSRTTDNSNIFIRSREVRDNKSRLYFMIIYLGIKYESNTYQSFFKTRKVFQKVNEKVNLGRPNARLP